jgi:hypothetical protein
MRYLFCLLFAITSAIAQPVQGPYEIATLDQDHSFRSIGVGTRGEFVDVFYFADSVLFAAEFSIESQTLTRPPHELRRFSDVTRLEIYDPIALDENRWGCLVYEGREIGINRTYLIHGDHDSFSETVFDSGYVNFYYPNAGDNWNETFSLTPREGGGAIAGWIEGVFAESEPRFGPKVCLLSDEGQVDTVIDLGQNALWNPTWNRPVFRSINHDIVVGSWGGDPPNIWGNDPAGINEVTEVEDCDFITVLGFGITRNNRILSISLTSSIPEFLQVEEYVADEPLNFSCANHREIYEMIDAGETFWHPNYGFAVLTRNSEIRVARLDTTLADVQPPGIFYGDGYARDRDVSINDSGEVVVLWTEFSGSETPLRLAWVGWDTFLDTDADSRLKPIPSSISLSAYPNPFNSTVSLKYELNQAGEVNLAIYNLAGQEVSRLVHGQQSAGQHSIDWTPQGASGIYFAKLSTGHKDCLSKLVYIR